MGRSRSRSPVYNRRRSPDVRQSSFRDRKERSRSPIRKRSRSPLRRRHSPEPAKKISCAECRHSYTTVRELVDHEVRQHDMRIRCAHCSTKCPSVAELADHIMDEHKHKRIICYYCSRDFGVTSDRASKTEWSDFRAHVYKEVVTKQVNKYSEKVMGEEVTHRGKGNCPHGPPVKCKNFPNCPGRYCYFSHPLCRFNTSCDKQSCVYDHSDVPRVCHDCQNRKRQRRY
ncbi:unnamed protein product [Caenorhabditis angaria]|uniref:C2H2-type domain-containing protein n=1 Tax=Caenorhabditis angaria TaxID=860376 RepID=B6VBU2_9PELO|nr:hypothetical protein Csp3_JD02.013 [Caenorhabditis angaria]CAI5445822.1 unnamed protein product [Caenorhabditis angaria]